MVPFLTHDTACATVTGMTLSLAALTEHHTPFRQVSHNTFLMDTGVEVDPGSLTNDQLRARAWASGVDAIFRF